MYGRVMRFGVVVVVGMGAVVGSTVVEGDVGTVVDEVVGTVVDDEVAVVAADDDRPVDATTEVLGVARWVPEQPTEITARAVNPSHTERNPTQADCPFRSAVDKYRSMLVWVVKDHFRRGCWQTSDGPLACEGGLV
jgi:hypothetical protein